MRPDGAYVLYWMVAARRTRSSFALDSALRHAVRLGRPLVVLEALRVDYPWATARAHRFAMSGMAEQAAGFGRAGVGYLPYVEPAPGAGRGLLRALAERACVVVTDEHPGFFQLRMVERVGASLPVACEAVDSVGIVPLRAPEREWVRAADFRRVIARAREEHPERPVPCPLDGEFPRGGVVPPEILARWPSAGDLSALPIDHEVGPVPQIGGERAGLAQLAAFAETVDKYPDARRHLEEEGGSSRLSPWLHWGHVSPWQVEDAVSELPGADTFLGELVTWRELAHHTAYRRPAFDRYESLPAWALATLDQHRSDPRPALLSREQLEAALTPDPLWNAAQRQLRAEGVIHNALRMLWGKRVLTWSREPEEAFGWLVHLNNRWAVDGRDANSAAGIAWCFGRYDRPWPTRPIFGVVRAMTSESTGKKVRARRYLERWSGQG